MGEGKCTIWKFVSGNKKLALLSVAVFVGD